MSDTPVQPARPVSLFTIVFLLAIFASFLLVIRWFYQPAETAAFNARADNFPTQKADADVQWKANAESRRKALADHRAEEAKKAAEKMPIDRAMDLTVQKYGAKK